MTDEYGDDRVLKRGWYTLWIMLALILCSFIDRQVLTLVAVPLAASLHLNDSQLGIVQGLAFSIFTVAATYPLAWAADRFDRRIVVAGCIIVWSIGTVGCGLANNFFQLFVAVIAIAAGEAGLNPIVLACVPNLFTGRKRLLANGLLYVCSYLGVSAGLAAGGSAIGLLYSVHRDLPDALQHHEPWRLAFFLVASFALPFLPLLLFTRLDRGAALSVPEDSRADGFLSFVMGHKRTIGLVFLGLGLNIFAVTAYLLWSPIATIRLFGIAPAALGAAMGAASAVGTVAGTGLGTLAVQRLSKRRGAGAPVRFFRFVIVAAVPVMLAVPFVTTSTQFFILFALLMTAFSANGCTILAIIQDMAPTAFRTRMFAMWTMTAYLIGGCAPTLIGWLSNALGPAPRHGMIAMTLVTVPASIIATWLLRAAEQPFSDFVRNVAADPRRFLPRD